MQEYLDGSNENEPEDAKGPGQDDGVRADVRPEGDSCDVEPETRDRDDRNAVNDDDPQGKRAGLDRTATAELDQENERKDRSSGRAGQRPGDGVGDLKEVEKRGKQSESGDQKAAFDVEAHEAEVPIGKLASQCATEGDDDCGKTDK